MIKLLLGLVRDFLLVLDLLCQLLGLRKGVDCLLIVEYVALRATKHVKDPLLNVPLCPFVRVGRLNEPLVLLVKGGVLLLHHQIAQLFREALERNDEID